VVLFQIVPSSSSKNYRDILNNNKYSAALREKKEHLILEITVTDQPATNNQ
jgi:hypothetical protein